MATTMRQMLEAGVHFGHHQYWRGRRNDPAQCEPTRRSRWCRERELRDLVRFSDGGLRFHERKRHLHWEDGDATSKSIAVAVTNDVTDEGDETFTVTLSNASAGTPLGPNSTATVTIVDDDLPDGNAGGSGGGGGGGGALDWLALLCLACLALARRAARAPT